MPDGAIDFTYQPRDGTSELDAYDASQALYGISRSVAITTEYVLSQRVIKQATALAGAKVLIRPPKLGSFKFPIHIIQTDEELELDCGALYDLIGVLYNRATGQRDIPANEGLQSLLSDRRGDIEALSDAIEVDVLRLHRPIATTRWSTARADLTIRAESRVLSKFDQKTFDFASTSLVSRDVETFQGSIASYNSNQDSGRLFLEEEGRTVSFRRDKSLKQLPDDGRRVLSRSLDNYVNRRPSDVMMAGRTVRSREGRLKAIFVVHARNLY